MINLDLLIFQEWIETNNVLSIVLKDNLHQPQVKNISYFIEDLQ